MEAAAGEPDFDVSRSTIAWIVNLVNIYLIRYPFERYSLPLGEVDQDAAARWEDTRLGLVPSWGGCGTWECPSLAGSGGCSSPCNKFQSGPLARQKRENAPSVPIFRPHIPLRPLV